MLRYVGNIESLWKNALVNLECDGIYEASFPLIWGFAQIVRNMNTDKKEKKIFLIYKEIRNGAVAKSYIRKGFLKKYMRKWENISPYMRRPLVIYDFTTAPLWIFYIMRQICFSFFSVQRNVVVPHGGLCVRILLLIFHSLFKGTGSPLSR